MNKNKCPFDLLFSTIDEENPVCMASAKQWQREIRRENGACLSCPGLLEFQTHWLENRNYGDTINVPAKTVRVVKAKTKPRLVYSYGNIADAGKFDDWGESIYFVVGGIHNGHKITLTTEKHNCGAWGESVECSCGAVWQSSMYGCHRHQQKESGDKNLEELIILTRCYEDE